MFENNDWNVDENYLRDFNEDELKIVQDKKRKVFEISFKRDAVNTKLTTNHLQLKFKFNGLKHSKNNMKIQSNDFSFQKNRFFNISKNTDFETDLKFNEASICKSYCSVYKSRELFTSMFNFIHNNEIDSVFNLIFKNECNIKSNILKSKPTKPIVKLVLQSSEHLLDNKNKLKRKKGVIFSESFNDINKFNKKSIELNQFSKSLNKYQGLRHKNPLLFNEQNIFDNNNLNDSQKLLDLQLSPNKKRIRLSRSKQTLIRKFPGPAGLLVNLNDEFELKDIDYIDKVNKNTSIIDCSQNTKNIFLTGAWQLMMDDLPTNFELFNIANVKEKAIEFSKIFKKVPYLAGIIQHIDYKPNNPQIILKDLSGQIDACIHYTICKAYPHTLGNNTVILLKDVRLIVTSKNYICIIISIKNLVSIYSDNFRLVQTSFLKQLLNTNFNSNLSEL